MDVDIVTIGGIIVIATFGFLFAGPLGAIVVGLIVVIVGATTGASKNDDTGGAVNCPDCGSIVAPEDTDCSHCETTIDDAA